MVLFNHRGAEFGWGSPLDDNINRLRRMVTELGIEVEDILFNAVTALLGEGIEGAQHARAAGVECEQRYQQAHQLGLDLLMDGRATAEQASAILQLQDLGQAFRRISQEAVRIAVHSLSMRQPVDDILAVANASMNLLEYLVEQTRIQVRNTIIFTTTSDPRYARLILEDAPDLERAYMVLESRVQTAIRERPRTSFPVTQLLGIATWLEHIGKVCRTAADTVLFDPPSRHP